MTLLLLRTMRDRRLNQSRRTQTAGRLSLLGLDHCITCHCPRDKHRHPERRVPGKCSECVNCKRYQPHSLW